MRAEGRWVKGHDTLRESLGKVRTIEEFKISLGFPRLVFLLQ
jgi:hypothetical protein